MISIIVPAYNAQDFISRCIESIQKQTYKELDIVIVDDGSTDDTALICGKLAADDSRIRVITKTNGGVSSARNTGLDNAQAENIMFVDSDDWIEADYCENMLAYAENYDWVCSGYYKELIWGTKKYDVDRLMEFHDNNSDFFEAAFGKGLFCSLWNKLYKRSLIGSQRFDESVYFGEDHFFNLEYLKKCSDIVIANNNLYHYNCKNDSSVTRKSYKNDISSIVYIYDETIKYSDTYLDGSHKELIKKDFVLSGIGLVQRIYYANIRYKDKKIYLDNLFGSNAFKECFFGKYHLKGQYRLIQWMCKNKLFVIMNLFFAIKKKVYLKIV